MKPIDRSILRQLLTALAILTVVGFGYEGVHAQSTDATPGISNPDQAICPSSSRTVDSLRAVFADATPEVDDLAGAESVTLPLGDPADEEIVTEITETLHQAIACMNNGDLLGFLSLLTDRAIVTTFPWFADYVLSEDASAEVLNEGPLPPELVQTLVAVGGAIVLDDGRFVAVMILDDPADEREGASALILTFIQTDTGLLIDEVASLEREDQS